MSTLNGRYRIDMTWPGRKDHLEVLSKDHPPHHSWSVRLALCRDQYAFVRTRANSGNPETRRFWRLYKLGRDEILYRGMTGE